MDGNARIGRVQLSPVSPASSSPGGDFSDSRSNEEAERVARYRLVIEQGAAKGDFIYKILDRETGEVVKQLPREEVARLGQRFGYEAGSVIDTLI